MNRIVFALLVAAPMSALAQTKVEKKAAAPAPAVATTKHAPAAKPAAATGLVANKDSKTFHKADCKAAAKIKDANKTTFASAAKATQAGYEACRTCKP